MKSIRWGILIAVVLAWGSAFAQDPAPLPMFKTEAAAREHCPDDTVVWLDTDAGTYYLPGQRDYGVAVGGAFVCKREADRSGDHGNRRKDQ